MRGKLLESNHRTSEYNTDMTYDDLKRYTMPRPTENGSELSASRISTLYDASEDEMFGLLTQVSQLMNLSQKIFVHPGLLYIVNTLNTF